MSKRYFLAHKTPYGMTTVVDKLVGITEGLVEATAQFTRGGGGYSGNVLVSNNVLAAGLDGAQWGWGETGVWGTKVYEPQAGDASMYLESPLKLAAWEDATNGIYFSMDWDEVASEKMDVLLSSNGDGYPGLRIRFTFPNAAPVLTTGTITVYQSGSGGTPADAVQYFWTNLIGTHQAL
jgi:hypothetical protein